MRRPSLRITVLGAVAVAVAGAALQAPSASGTAVADTWEPAPPLDECTPPSPSCTGRVEHAAALLPDGKVLVVGGNLSPNTAQVYDPATSSWSPTAPMAETVPLASATTLPNGKVLVIGAGTPELYDPEEGTWEAAPAPPTGHAQGTVSVLGNGKVLVAGGLGVERGTAAADIYDPGTNNWSSTGAMIDVRSQHAATLLPDGTVLVAGGFSDNYGPKRDTAEIYDPETGMWSPTGGLPSGAVGQTATVLGNGQVLLAGGQSEEAVSAAGPGDRLAQLYDPETGTWTATGEMASGRSAHTATLLPDGTVLVVGGVSTIPGLGVEAPEEATQAELYDPAAGTWSPAARPGVVRAQHTATLLPPGPASACGEHCGKLLVVGGRGGFGPEAAATATHAELYQAPPGSVSAPLPTAPAAPSSGSGGTNGADDGSSFPLAVVIPAALVLVGAAVFVVVRRRRPTAKAR